jgi:hypothetical protein
MREDGGFVCGIGKKRRVPAALAADTWRGGAPTLQRQAQQLRLLTALRKASIIA